MKTITLQSETYQSVDDFYADIAKKLNFPDHFGANLDAFEECLTDSACKEPITIVWDGYEKSRMVFGVNEAGVNYLTALLTIMSETKGVTLLLS